MSFAFGVHSLCFLQLNSPSMSFVFGVHFLFVLQLCFVYIPVFSLFQVYVVLHFDFFASVCLFLFFLSLLPQKTNAFPYRLLVDFPMTSFCCSELYCC